MNILVFDTETTGLFRSSDITSPNNPYMASIAAILYSSSLSRITASLNAPILPEGWAMPDEAAAINGLTNQFLADNGLPITSILPSLFGILDKADLLVGHNVDFDLKVLATAIWRNSNQTDDDYAVLSAWLQKPSFCTMKESKQQVQAKTVNGRLKYPKLTEAYQHFFGKELDRAHSANADAVATLEIYLALQD